MRIALLATLSTTLLALAPAEAHACGMPLRVMEHPLVVDNGPAPLKATPGQPGLEELMVLIDRAAETDPVDTPPRAEDTRTQPKPRS